MRFEIQPCLTLIHQLWGKKVRQMNTPACFSSDPLRLVFSHFPQYLMHLALTTGGNLFLLIIESCFARIDGTQSDHRELMLVATRLSSHSPFVYRLTGYVLSSDDHLHLYAETNGLICGFLHSYTDPSIIGVCSVAVMRYP